MGQCAPYLLHCGFRPVEGVKSSAVASHQVSKDHLDRALATFHSVGAAVAAREGSQSTKEAWEHAYSITAALVTGVHSHIPEAFQRVEVIEGAQCKLKCQCLQSRGNTVVAAVKVHLWPSQVLGEIATRSRVSSQLCLEKEVCFALQQPPSDLTAEPLVLEISGLSFPCLPESRALRKKLKAMLGDKYSKQTAYEYFEKVKYTDYLAQDSKLRRIHASLFEVASLVKPPAWVCSKSLFGHLNAPSNVFEALEFWDEGPAGIRVTSRKAPPPDEDESQCVAISDSIVVDLLTSEVDSRMARNFFNSAFNFGCLNTARANGYPGARPDLIAKLFSGADEWGPAASGWQSYDNTWLCTDVKSSFGKTKEQGRVVWISPGASGIPRTPADRASRVSALANVASSGDPTASSSNVKRVEGEPSVSMPPLSLLIIVAMIGLVMSWLQIYSAGATALDP